MLANVYLHYVLDLWADWWRKTHAARLRKARGEGKPETFTFLGFRHIARMSRGRFWIQRTTDKKKMAAKLKSVKAELMRRRHLPVPEQGRWLASVTSGH